MGGSTRPGYISESLYELSDRLEQLINECVDRETGELDPLFEAKLEKLEGDWEKKAIQVALYVKGLETEAEAAKACAQAIEKTARDDRARSKQLYGQADRLRNMLAGQLQDRGLSKLRDPEGRAALGFRKSTRCVIDRPNLVPKSLCVQADPEPSVSKIKEWLKAKGRDELERALPVADSDGEKAKVVVAHLETFENLQIK